jgi:hypothetical protein
MTPRENFVEGVAKMEPMAGIVWPIRDCEIIMPDFIGKSSQITLTNSCLY